MARTFAEWLHTYRKERGESQRSLGAKAGISDAMISLLEMGKRNPSRDMVEQIARALAAPLSEGLLLAGFVPPRDAEADGESAPPLEYVSDPDEQYLLESYRGIDSPADRDLARRMLDALRRREKDSAVGGRRADDADHGDDADHADGGTEGEDTAHEPGNDPGPDGDLAE